MPDMRTAAPIPSKPSIAPIVAGWGLIAYAGWTLLRKLAAPETNDIMHDANLTTPDKLILIYGASIFDFICAILILRKINVGRMLWMLLTVFAWIFWIFSTCASLFELVTLDTLAQAVIIALLFLPGSNDYFRAGNNL